MRGNILLEVFGIGLIFLFIIGIFSMYTVNTGTVGVKSTFGEAKSELGPGLHFIIPFIERVDLLSTQIIKYEVPSSAASKDLQIVTSTIAVNYKLDQNRVLTVWQEFRGDYEVRVIDPITHETVKGITAQYTANDLITKREEVKVQIENKLKENLKDYGLTVVEVSIVNFDFSNEFNKAIELKVKAEQDKLTMQQELETAQIEVQKKVATANAEAESLKLSTDAKAYQMKTMADAEAYQIEMLAQANAESIMKVNAALSDSYINYYQVNKWNGVMPYVMGDSNLLLEIPFNKS